MIRKKICQNNTTLRDYYYTAHRIFILLIHNNITPAYVNAKTFNVNKMLLLLIFIVVEWYNVFIEYIFSSQFIIN